MIFKQRFFSYKNINLFITCYYCYFKYMKEEGFTYKSINNQECKLCVTKDVEFIHKS